MVRQKKRARDVRHTIFFKVLTGYVVVTLLVASLTGLVSFVLVRQYIIRTNLNDLTSKSETIGAMLARADGRLRLLTARGLNEVEALCDAQLIYVDRDLVARQMPVKEKRARDADAPSLGDAVAGGQWPQHIPALPDCFELFRDDGPFASWFFEELPEKQSPDVQDNKILNKVRKVARATPAPTEKPEVEPPLQRIELSGSVDAQLIRSIMGGNTATDVRQLQFMTAPMMFTGTPIIDSESGEVTAAIILCRPLTEIGPTTANILWMLALAATVAIPCAALLAFFMSRRLTRPITNLSTIAAHMTEGHYGERCNVGEKGEIGQLGESLNLLSSRLTTVIGTLNDEKSKLEKILSSIGEGIIAVDRDGRVLHYNAAALGLLELKAWDVHPGNPHSLEHQQQLIEMLSRSMHKSERIVTTWETLAGRAIEAIASPVIGAAGDLIGAVCLVRDVSEAQRIEQMRRDYIANISHELRTPLTGIRGMVEPLMDGLMETEQEKNDCYQVIYQETIRLEKLIGEMLDLSRLQGGRIQLELEPMLPDGILEAAARRLRERAQAGGVTLRVSSEEKDLALMGNEDRILQVLIILTDNALAFTPPGGTVTLFARRVPEADALRLNSGAQDAGETFADAGEACDARDVGEICADAQDAGETFADAQDAGAPCAVARVALGVSDTGSGIDPVDLPYIWERFYKADRSRMRTCGTGLGLSIAKLVVELMGGTIDVETEVGRGSTFTFTLPGVKL
ncbi:MAG: ATP-binding protein [Clostridia bacterium]